MFLSTFIQKPIRPRAVAVAALLCGLAALLLGDSLLAQRRTTPRAVFNTNQVRVVRFSHDSQTAYSAGLNKVVHGWELIQRGRIRKRNFMRQVDPLRWELGRGPRGLIYAMDVSPTDHLVAVAGYGARTNPIGMISVFDSRTGEVQLLPPEAKFDRVDNQMVINNGHDRSIYALSFSPNGKKLASISLDGELRVWNTEDWSSERFTKRGKIFTALKAVFIDDRWVVRSHQRSDGKWRLAFYDTTREQGPFALTQDHVNGITMLARDPASDRWLSADWAGNLYLWNGADDRKPDLIRRDSVVAGAAFGPQNTLFVATKVFEPSPTAPPIANTSERIPARLEWWDLDSGALIDQTDISWIEDNWDCAVSPDGKWVVTGGGDDSSIAAYAIPDKGAADPLSELKRIKENIHGRTIGNVAFTSSAPPYQIAFGSVGRDEWKFKFNQYGRARQVFNLSSPLAVENLPARERLVNPNDSVGGWAVETSSDLQTLTLKKAGRLVTNIKLDKTGQGRARSFCWLNNARETFGIAVGTDLQCGVYIYQFLRGRTARVEGVRLVRYFRDHSGWVTSLSLSSDGRYLASGSADQTIKLWSMDGIRGAGSATDGAAPRMMWGATFGVVGGKVTAANVANAGTAARKGIANGDQITWLAYPTGGRFRVTEDANEIARALRSATVFEQLDMKVKKPGKAEKGIGIVPAWAPLVTLYVDRRNEWVLATPSGPYNASPRGEKLFGWHVNVGDGVTEFHRGDQFRDKLNQPEVLQELLTLGNLKDAAIKAGAGNVGPLEAFVEELEGNKVVDNLTRVAPTIRIQNPQRGESLAEDDAPTLQALVDFHRPELAGEYTLRALVNGVQLGDPTSIEAVDANQRLMQWAVPSVLHISNMALVVAVDKDDQLRPGEDDSRVVSAIDRVHFRGKPPEGPRKLHLLAIAAAEYPEETQKLRFPIKDAQAFATALDQQGANLVGDEKLYEKGTFQSLFHSETTVITPTTLEEKLAAFKAADPGDLLVVFMSGHGVALDDEYYYIPPHEKLKGFAGLSESDVDNEAGKEVIREVGISWTLLRTLLRDVPCRKMMFLDTCHSGIVADEPNAEDVEQAASKKYPDQWNDLVRTLTDEQILVFTATNPGQVAVEYPSKGHGIFTFCMLKGFTGAADKARDQEVDFTEIVKFTSDEVRRQTKGGHYQTPLTSPDELVEISEIPIVRYVLELPVEEDPSESGD